jgi:uncharacterized protein YbjT (DUF2867 family)
VTDPRSIAITGVTGSQGGAAARHLRAAGWTVRGLTRNPNGKGAERARAAGVELVPGDMSDSAALDRLVTGAHGVYAVTDFFQNGLTREVEQGKLIADAAMRAGVRHLVFPSLALADQQTGIPYFEAKAAIERHIASIGVPATILRPAIFMEDLVDPKYAPPMWWGSMRRTVGADKKLYWIAVDDVGAIVARIFADPDAYIGRAITVAGDYRSMAEAAEIFTRVTGKRPLAIPAPLWLIRRVVNADLVPMWGWLGRNPVVADLAPARKILPEIMDMERWLKGRTASPRSPS